MRNRKYTNNQRRRRQDNKKRRSYYPPDIARIDQELAAEVRLALMLGISEKVVMKNYGLTYKQIDYCKKNGKSFEDLKKEEE